MGAQWVGEWTGGRIRVTSSGTRVWVIERSIRRRRYAISLKVTSERDAEAELALFLRDPPAYAAALEAEPLDAAAGKALLVDAQLIERFVAWCLERELNEEYVHGILEAYLKAWSEKLGRRDLRKITTVELRQLLSKWTTARPHRIVALKALTAWLRDEEGLLTSQTDPTLDLKSSKPKKKRAEDEKKAFALRDVEVAYRCIDFQLVRDLAGLVFRRGFHISEVLRFGEGRGKLRDVGPWEGCPIAATLTVNHKNGDPHTVSLDAADRDRAQRLREAGGCSRSWAAQHLREIAERHNVPHLLLGSGRHSFITWCRTPGLGVQKHEPPQPAISLDDVMVVTGHRTAATPRHHYDEAQHVPHMLEVPLRLVHADDPPVQHVVKLGERARDRR